MKILGREPARWIGVIVAIVLAVVRVLVGDELISPDAGDSITNLVQKAADFAVLLAPIFAGELIRPQVTPVAAPKLEEGTPIKVSDPATGETIGVKTLTL